MKNIKIENFKGIKVELKDLEEIVIKNGEDTAKELHDKSPKGVRVANKYADGWVSERRGKTDKPEVLIWNKTNWQLTWLLENGHIVGNAIGRVGWAAPRRHIKDIFESQSEKFIKDMENIELEVDFK